MPYTRKLNNVFDAKKLIHLKGLSNKYIHDMFF